MKNKVVIVINPDGVITFESVESVVQPNGKLISGDDTIISVTWVKRDDSGAVPAKSSEFIPPAWDGLGESFNKKNIFKENDRVVVNNKLLDCHGRKGTIVGISTHRTLIVKIDGGDKTPTLFHYTNVYLLHEKTIPFDIELWRKGDFKKVVTRDGVEIQELTCFKADGFPLIGTANNMLFNWKIDGRSAYCKEEDSSDLMLIVETPEQ